MQPAFLKTLLILSLIAGLAAPASAAKEEDKSSAKSEKKQKSENSEKVQSNKTEKREKSAKEKNKTAVNYEMEGAMVKTGEQEVAGIIMRITPVSLSLELSSDTTGSTDMLFSMDENTEFKGKKSAKEFSMGDTVKVLYKQEYSEETGEKVILRTVVKSVTLVKAVQKGL